MGLLSENNVLLITAIRKEPGGATSSLLMAQGKPLSIVVMGYWKKYARRLFVGMNDFKRNLKLFLRETDCKEVAP